MNFSSQDDLRKAGFSGFHPIRDLQASRCADAPRSAGVYMIVRQSGASPSFLQTSCGGHFKGRNPTVPAEVLRANWVDGTVVVYIGKAGGGTSNATLQKRLDSYMRFGTGAPVGHWGGRYIWQLSDSEDLLVCWVAPAGEDAIQLETRLIQEFARQHGKRPFANLRD